MIALVSSRATKWGEGCISLCTAGDRAFNTKGFVCAAQVHSGVIKLKIIKIIKIIKAVE